MPLVGDAVKINAVTEMAAVPAREWGVPAVVGESDYVTKNTPKLYYSVADVKNDHGAGTNVTKAAEGLFAQGVNKIYARSMEVATPGSPTATEVENALAKFASYAENNLINGVMLAGITADQDTLTAKLKAFADGYNLVFVVTNKADETVANIVSQASGLASPNGVYLAHADSDITEDVAAQGLGVLMTLKPWVTLFWKPITTSVNEYFAPGDVPTLESGKVNVIAEIANANRISNGLTTGGDPKFIDVTRTKYYAIAKIKDAIASLRLKMEKIPYDNRGLGMVKSVITKALEEMVLVGALREHRPEENLPAYQVVMPQLSAISDTDKVNRVLKNVYVKGYLAGDIHTFEVNLVITI